MEGVKVGSRSGPTRDVISLDLRAEVRDHVSPGYSVWKLGKKAKLSYVLPVVPALRQGDCFEF